MDKRTLRRSAFGVLCLAGLPVLAAGAAPAWAQERGDAAAQGKGPGEVTFDVVERPLKDVVAYIQDKTEVNIVLTREAEEIPVTVKLKNLPWREALEVVVERAGAQIDERSANLIRIEKPPRVEFDFEDADARKVINLIAAAANANIVIGKEVEGTISLKLKDVPWRTALDTIVKTLGYAVVQEERGILRIVDPSSLKAQLENRLFKLKFVRPPANYKPIIETQVSKSSVTAPGDDQAALEKEFKLLEAFKQAVAPEGNVTYIAETNSLIVNATAPKLDALEKLIARVDVEPAQVFVDVKFIATSNTDFLDMGFGPGTDGIAATQTLGKMQTVLPFTLGKGGFEDHLSPFRGGAEKYGPLPVTDAGAAFTFGTLDMTKTAFALNLIKRDKSSRVVQAPKLVTLDNQAATIFVGDTIRYAVTKATSNQSGGLEFSLEEAPDSPVQVGFQLLMIPHVIPDKDQIMMTVIPQQRSLTGSVGGFEEFVVGAGSTIGEQRLRLPKETSSTVVTNLKLDNGHTAVIGGLIQDRKSNSQNKIPFLGDIPVLGYLFRSDTTDNSRDNLIIFLTPRIVRDEQQMRGLVLREMNEAKDRIEAELLDMKGDTALDAALTPDNRSDAPKPGLAGPK